MPSASAGAPSVSRLIQRICVASSGTAIASPVSSSPITPARTTPKNIVKTSPMFDESRKRRNLRMLAKIAAALADGADDRREVVVGEDHVRRLLGDVGAGDAHRDADVRRLQRGRVVDPVAGHRDDPPVRVERVDDPQLVLRRDAGVDGHLPHRGRAARRRRSPRARAPVTTRAPAAAMPRSAAIRAAVCGWSPVIISTRTPAACASAIATRASGRGGSMIPTSPR